jgi:hypothetical protein
MLLPHLLLQEFFEDTTIVSNGTVTAVPAVGSNSANDLLAVKNTQDFDFG